MVQALNWIFDQQKSMFNGSRSKISITAKQLAEKQPRQKQQHHFPLLFNKDKQNIDMNPSQAHRLVRYKNQLGQSYLS